MIKNRITRKSLKRKIIGGASALFMAVALIATGFAAWIISADHTVEANIGVSVATVSNSVMTISVNGLSDNGAFDQTLAFEPVESDNSGRVRYDSKDGGRESLTISLTGKVTNAQHLGTLSVVIDYNNSNLIAAAEAGYITLHNAEINNDGISTITLNKLVNENNGENTSQILSEEAFIEAVASGSISNGYILVANVDKNGNAITENGAQTYTAYFNYTITFGWGEYFESVNPCYYYDGYLSNDSREEGNRIEHYDDVMALTTSEIIAQLSNFKALLEDGLDGAGSLNMTVKADIK